MYVKRRQFTMVETLYSAEVDITIILPTTVAQQHNTKCQWFHIDSNIDDGTGQ